MTEFALARAMANILTLIENCGFLKAKTLPKRGKTQQNQEKGTSQTPQDKWFREPARITLPTLSSAIGKYNQPNLILFFLWGGVLGGFYFGRFLRRLLNKNRKNRRHGNFQGKL